MVLLDELRAMQVSPLLLPISKEPRLARAMEQLIAEPGCRDGIEELARSAAASPRTLARLFKSETGMTFSQWKTRLRLVESVERLSRGENVTEVALDLGFGTTSSFVFMFRKHMGASPGRFRSAG
jgi:AraC-like DNA-binding protein